MSVSTIDYPHPIPAVLTRWHVSAGANVEEGTLLAEFEGKYDHSYITLVAPHEGKIEELLAKEGSTCTTSTPMFRISVCLHNIQYAGMCASCGKDLTVSLAQGSSKLSDVAIIHSQPRLTVTMQEAQRVDKETAGRLLKQKQLSLVLDLDHTLIHAATETHFHQFALQNCIDPKAEQLHQFFLPGSSVNYFVKLRPHLKSFLEEVSRMFELHMYTFGTRMYALKVAQIIDPGHKIFKERILSRDDCGDIDYKTLKRIFPCDDSMVVIVDDREDVWKKSKNLVRIEPFLYFVGLPDVNPHPFDRQPHRPQAPPQLPPGHTLPQPRPPPQPHRQRPPSRRSAPNTRPTLAPSATNDEKKSEKRKDQDTKNEQQENKKPKVKDGHDEIENEKQGSTSGENSMTQNNEPGEDNKSITTIETSSPNMLPDEDVEDMKNKLDVEAASTTQPQNGQKQHSDLEFQKTDSLIEEKQTILDTKDENNSMMETNTKEKSDSTVETNDIDVKSTPRSGDAARVPQKRPDSLPPQWPPPPDECLPIILDVLREVHKRFYTLHDAHQECDVKDIITTMKRSVLVGCFVVFSGFYPREVDPRVTPLGRLAENFGAVCQLDLSKTTTHVIAKKNHTDKVKTALARRITIVTENWLHASTRRWQRVPEADYCLPPDDSQPADSSGTKSQRTNTDTRPDRKHEIKQESKPNPKHPTKHDLKHDAKYDAKRSHATDNKVLNFHNEHKSTKSTKNTIETNDLPYPEMVPSKSILEEMKQEAEMFDDDDEMDDEDEGHDYQDENEAEDDNNYKPKQKRQSLTKHYDNNNENDEDDDFASFLESELVNQ